jgi:uncharacterized damage-inducible protein DinB
MQLHLSRFFLPLNVNGEFIHMKLYPALIDRLKNQHLAIPEIIAGLAPMQIERRPAENKWNIHDNLAHLAKYQFTFINRLHEIINQPGSSFGRYVAAEDPEFEIFRNKTISELLISLNEQRMNLFDLVFSLSSDNLKKIGIHKKFGPMNIVQWLEFFVLHEAHHIFTIFQLAHDTDV